MKKIVGLIGLMVLCLLIMFCAKEKAESEEELNLEQKIGQLQEKMQDQELQNQIRQKFVKAEEYYRYDDFEKAKEICDEILKIDPSNFLALELLKQIMSKERQRE